MNLSSKKENNECYTYFQITGSFDPDGIPPVVTGAIHTHTTIDELVTGVGGCITGTVGLGVALGLTLVDPVKDIGVVEVLEVVLVFAVLYGVVVVV